MSGVSKKGREFRENLRAIRSAPGLSIGSGKNRIATLWILGFVVDGLAVTAIITEVEPETLGTNRIFLVSSLAAGRTWD
jgi:hypothetical protein